MSIITKQINLIERIDQLVRLQATGSPVELAIRLNISRAKLYRIIEIMKELNAPIAFDFAVQSFVYEEEVGFQCGFYTRDLFPTEVRSINGGIEFNLKKLHWLAGVS